MDGAIRELLTSDVDGLLDVTVFFQHSKNLFEIRNEVNTFSRQYRSIITAYIF